MSSKQVNTRCYRNRRARRLLLISGVLLALFGSCVLAYLAWSPGKQIRDGRHDLRSNGIWISHGWLGDDEWFVNRRDKAHFRDALQIQKLAAKLRNHGVRYVFPHLCPCSHDGPIPPVDPDQTERFLDAFDGFEVLPWIGGVADKHCVPGSSEWRTAFISSAVDLLRSHPRLAGVHLNIEPMPSGDPDFLELLDELRRELPDGKTISVAAYPPPTLWQPYSEVHWQEDYFREVAKRVDQLAVMMYETGIVLPKAYESLLSTWTSNVLKWSEGRQILLGIPAYNAVGLGSHLSYVESLGNALAGIHAGLCTFKSLPEHYTGVALYCEWQMDADKWACFSKEYEKGVTVSQRACE